MNQNGDTGFQPLFVTFTGVDDSTDIDGMFRLSEQYPIEWGVLFSPKRQGQGRYPSPSFIHRLVDSRMRNGHKLNLSAHLCGNDARMVVATGTSPHDLLLRGNFQRAQINTAELNVDLERIAAWGRALDLIPILQCRGAFPSHAGVQFLFDTSGGRGLLPDAWPAAHRSGEFVGYAGGLNPDNVAAAVRAIGMAATQAWVDLETGARDEQDRFSLQKCQAVCEAVFGPAHSRLVAAA